jgi:hypothetical protein
MITPSHVLHPSLALRKDIDTNCFSRASRSHRSTVTVPCRKMATMKDTVGIPFARASLGISGRRPMRRATILTIRAKLQARQLVLLSQTHLYPGNGYLTH